MSLRRAASDVAPCLEASRASALASHSAASLAAAAGLLEAARLLRCAEALSRAATATLTATKTTTRARTAAANGQGVAPTGSAPTASEDLPKKRNRKKRKGKGKDAENFGDGAPGVTGPPKRDAQAPRRPSVRPASSAAVASDNPDAMATDDLADEWADSVGMLERPAKAATRRAKGGKSLVGKVMKIADDPAGAPLLPGTRCRVVSDDKASLDVDVQPEFTDATLRISRSILRECLFAREFQGLEAVLPEVPSIFCGPRDAVG